MPEAVNFGDAEKQAQDAGLLGGGGDTYKYKEGDNRFRLLSKTLPHTSEYQGNRSFKWLCYVLDRRDGKVKLHFMPHKIHKAIAALQLSEDYAFAEVPMPYDLTVQAKGAGTKEVEYAVVPARREVPLTEAEEREFHKATPLDDVQAKLKEKQQAKAPAQPAPIAEPVSEDLTDDSIPF